MANSNSSLSSGFKFKIKFPKTSKLFIVAKSKIAKSLVFNVPEGVTPSEFCTDVAYCEN